MLQNDINKAYKTALNLERTVIDDAKRKAEKIVTEARLAEKKAVAAATADARLHTEQYEQHERAAISAKYSNILTEHTSHCKTELIKKRTEIQNTVFEKLENKIREFTKSDDYEDFAANSLSKLKDCGLSGNIDISVSAVPADKKAAKKIFPDSNITVSDSIKLGGFIVRDNEKEVMYDLTLDSSFELKKSDFPAVSGLRISD